MNMLKKTSTINTTYQSNRAIKYIVLHYTAGTKSASGTAENTAAWFMSGKAGGSADYIVDDKNIIQYNPDPKNRYCWSVGGSRYSKMTTTEGGKYYGVCTNANSISIEMCSRKKDISNLNGDATDWYFTEEVVNNTVELTKYLMKQYNVPIDNVVMHHHVTGKVCLPIQTTEILTTDGWKKLKDIVVGENIVAYDSKKDCLVYSSVLDKVEPYKAKTLTNRRLEATGNHRMYVAPNDSRQVNKYRDMCWEDVLTKKRQYLIKTSSYFEEYQGLDVTDDELRLLVWVQGDGHYMRVPYSDHVSGLDFHFRKQRKVDRFLTLLKDLDIKYKLTIQKDGTARIKIKDPQLYLWCEKYLDNKNFTYNFVKMTRHQYEIFFEELVLVDGNISKKSYCSSIEQNLDIVQAIHCTHGQRSNICQTGISRSVITTNANYSVGIGCRKREDSLSERHTEVSCVTVDTGYILIRQCGKTFIVGNCPNPWVVNQSRLSSWYDFKKKLVEDEVLNLSQYEELKKEISGIQKEINEGREKIFNTIEEVPDWARPTIEKLIKKGCLKGTENGLGLTYTLARVLVVNDRAGVYDGK